MVNLYAKNQFLQISLGFINKWLLLLTGDYKSKPNGD